jgi:hypothetical protein
VGSGRGERSWKGVRGVRGHEVSGHFSGSRVDKEKGGGRGRGEGAGGQGGERSWAEGQGGKVSRVW